jgi:hypothetical protein
VFSPLRWPSSSTTKSLVEMQYSRGSAQEEKPCENPVVLSEYNRRTIAEMSSNLCVTIVGPEDPGCNFSSMTSWHVKAGYSPGPLGPRVVAASGDWRTRKQLEVGDRLGTVAHRGANAIIASISTSNNNDILALGVDVTTVLKLRVEKRLRVQLE